MAPANEDHEPAIVTTIGRKRLKLLCADEWAAEPHDPEEAVCRHSWHGTPALGGCGASRGTVCTFARTKPLIFLGREIKLRSEIFTLSV